MLKGHLQIDLHNEITGEDKRIEQDKGMYSALPQMREAKAQISLMTFSRQRPKRWEGCSCLTEHLQRMQQTSTFQ